MYYIESDYDPWETSYGTQCTENTGHRGIYHSFARAKSRAKHHATSPNNVTDYEWRDFGHAEVLVPKLTEDPPRIHAEVREVSAGSSIGAVNNTE